MSGLGIVIQRGRHTHIERDGKWFTSRDGVTFAEGFVPDPDLKEPKVKLDGHAAPEGVKRSLFHFKVMYSGWECDEDGWVVEMEDGSKAIVLSNHTRLYVAEPSELREKLVEYEGVVEATRAALGMVAE